MQGNLINSLLHRLRYLENIIIFYFVFFIIVFCGLCVKNILNTKSRQDKYRLTTKTVGEISNNLNVIPHVRDIASCSEHYSKREDPVGVTVEDMNC